jgi:ketosteroid isomerase-like protein
VTDEENLAFLMRLGDAFNDRGWDGVIEFVHPEIEFQEPPEQPGATVFHGIDEVRAGWARWADTWTEQESEAQGIELLPDGRILVFTRERMLGRDGLRVETDSGQLFTFRDGKIVRWQVFWDLDNARAAAGGV